MTDAELIGRESELAELTRRLSDARGGVCVVVQISGVEGVGKSSLVTAFRQSHRTDALVLNGYGLAWEQETRLGVLGQLLEQGPVRVPGLDDLANLDAGQVGARLATWLSEGRADAGRASKPCLITIDDAHFADGESLRALVSAIRRLTSSAVLVVLSLDTHKLDSAGPGAGAIRSLDCHRLVLRGLGVDDVRRLGRTVGAELSQQSAAALTRVCAGNPRTVLQVLSEQDPTLWRPVTQPWLAPREIRESTIGWLRPLSQASRALIDAAAVLGEHCLLSTAANVGEVADPIAAADEVVGTDLATISGADVAITLNFSDELTRSAVYAEISPLRRKEFHRRASVVQESLGDRLRHRAAVDAHTDSDLSEQLEACADAEGGVGMWADAADSLLLSSRLSPEQSNSDRRLYLAMEALVGAGEIVKAVDLLADVEARPADPLRDAALGYLAISRGRDQESEQYLEHAWVAVDDALHVPGHRRVAAMVARHRVLHCLARWDPEGMLAWSARGAELDPDGIDDLEAQSMIGLAQGMLGGLVEARNHYDVRIPMVRDSPQWQRMLMARGWVDLAGDEVTLARRELESALPTMRRGGSARIALWARGWLARTQFALGDWDGALACVEEGLATLATSGVDLLRPLVNWTGVQVHALRGDEDAALAFLQRIESRPNEFAIMDLPARLAATDLAEAGGDYESVVRTLRPLAQRYPAGHPVNEPGYWPWAGRYANALVITGRVEEASDFLPAHEQRAVVRGHLGAAAQLAIARARLSAAHGDLDGAEALLRETVAATATRPTPYRLAQLRLVAGQIIRRAGRRRAADAVLKDARKGFLALGATIEMRRCDQELRAGGQRRESGLRVELTPQETTVAQLVADGMSNKDVAADLFLSVKTVQFHLTRIYAKMGVRSRSELAAMLRPATDEEFRAE